MEENNLKISLALYIRFEFTSYFIIIKIHNFNILPVRSDIYFFLTFLLEIMKQARFLKVVIGHFQSIKTDVWLNFLKTTNTIRIG